MTIIATAATSRKLRDLILKAGWRLLRRTSGDKGTYVLSGEHRGFWLKCNTDGTLAACYQSTDAQSWEKLPVARMFMLVEQHIKENERAETFMEEAANVPFQRTRHPKRSPRRLAA